MLYREGGELLLIHASLRPEAPLTVLPSETILVQFHTDVRRCGAQLARVIYTIAVSAAADDRTFIGVQFIVAEQKIIGTVHLWISTSGVSYTERRTRTK